MPGEQIEVAPLTNSLIGVKNFLLATAQRVQKSEARRPVPNDALLAVGAQDQTVLGVLLQFKPRVQSGVGDVSTPTRRRLQSEGV